MNMLGMMAKKLLLFLPALLFIAVWEATSRAAVVNPLLFPPPTKVFLALLDWAREGTLWSDLKVSYVRMLLGFTGGAACGVLLGVFTGRVRAADRAISPIVQLLRPLPPVAVIPLIIVWLGIGDLAKVFSIGFAVFFPVWINTHLSCRAIPREYLWSAKMLSPTAWDMLVRIILPAAMPGILAGMRTAIAISFIMVYVSEIAGASSGIGYRISLAHLSYRIDIMMAALVVLAAAGALADWIFHRLSLQLFPWLRLAQGKDL